MEAKPVIIREVWAENLEFEFSLIEKAIPLHPLVSLDTEFPGTIFKSNHNSSASPHDVYSNMKLNVDVLKIVQLGLTLSDPNGNLPSFGTESSYIWQFNFRDFDIHRDPCNEESIKLLKKQGIDFNKNREKGIDSRIFGGRWVWSLVTSHYKSSSTWITFHGGYDIGLLIKIFTGQNLPSQLEWFLKLVEFYFGNHVYDLKYMSYNHGLHGGLEKLATNMGVYRICGNSHEAGSDSLLTLQTFIKFLHLYFDRINFNASHGVLYGLCFKTAYPYLLPIKFYANTYMTFPPLQSTTWFQVPEVL
ncbi:probable CCR4-associated factor 1 homolog 11 [Euphorbia lathyris]|uniref:probable CCR4-associated factor 1 homolog 11 n=1 Tax=Euphorbia lathyris TaxID=212925 RepID=UPI003313EFE2